MKRTLEQLREDAIEIPLTTQMRQRAKATGNPRMEQNALAVLAVAEYLGQWQGYAVQLEQSDVWNPVLRRLDVADLPIEGLGRVECRVVQRGQALEIPPEAWNDRIGYVVVELESEMARLVGFVLPFGPEQGEEIEILEIDQVLVQLAKIAIAVPILEAELGKMDGWRRVALIAQLERIYRTERASKRGVRAEEVLASRSTVGAVREGSKESKESIASQELAERLMEKLATVWDELRG